MKLKDTTAMMESNDYKERFKAEYFQLLIRFKKLKVMLDKWESGTLEFTPTCTKAVYNFQIKSMGEYLASLEIRAQIEGINLTNKDGDGNEQQ